MVVTSRGAPPVFDRRSLASAASKKKKKKKKKKTAKKTKNVSGPHPNPRPYCASFADAQLRPVPRHIPGSPVASAGS